MGAKDTITNSHIPCVTVMVSSKDVRIQVVVEALRCLTFYNIALSHYINTTRMMHVLFCS